MGIPASNLFKTPSTFRLNDKGLGMLDDIFNIEDQEERDRTIKIVYNLDDQQLKKFKKRNVNEELEELEELEEMNNLDKVDKKALKKDFDDREDKDIDNDGDIDNSDEYLHKRRKAITKAVDKVKESTEDTAELDEATNPDNARQIKKRASFHLSNAEKNLKEIQNQMGTLKKVVDKKSSALELHWGDVGDLERISQHLSQLADMMLGRGEYGPTAVGR